jgi:hypothetical protein
MRKLTKFSLVAAIVILVLSVSPAAASSPPLDVQFVVPQTWEDPPEGPIMGPFTASGPAVEAGLICSSGWTINIGGSVTKPDRNGKYTFHILKGFVCDGDDPNIDFFILHIDGRSFNDVSGTFNWNVWLASGVLASYTALVKDPSNMKILTISQIGLPGRCTSTDHLNKGFISTSK